MKNSYYQETDSLNTYIYTVEDKNGDSYNLPCFTLGTVSLEEHHSLLLLSKLFKLVLLNEVNLVFKSNTTSATIDWADFLNEPSLEFKIPWEDIAFPEHKESKESFNAKGKAIRLIDEWLDDDSGHDEKYWPIIKHSIEENRLSYRKKFDAESNNS